MWSSRDSTLVELRKYLGQSSEGLKAMVEAHPQPSCLYASKAKQEHVCPASRSGWLAGSHGSACPGREWKENKPAATQSKVWRWMWRLFWASQGKEGRGFACVAPTERPPLGCPALPEGLVLLVRKDKRVQAVSVWGLEWAAGKQVFSSRHCSF